MMKVFIKSPELLCDWKCGSVYECVVGMVVCGGCMSVGWCVYWGMEFSFSGDMTVDGNNIS